MPRSCQYIESAKQQLGDTGMSDRELGERLGVSGSLVAQARYGNMSDPLAMKVADLLGIHRAEVVSVARADREKDPEVKAALLDWVPKTLAAMSSKTAPVERGGMAAMVEQLAASPEAQKAKRPRGAPRKGVGGVGGIRTLDAGFAHILP
jgi:hypothetical protein